MKCNEFTYTIELYASYFRILFYEPETFLSLSAKDIINTTINMYSAAGINFLSQLIHSLMN